jgi:hypothetical protein
MYFVHNTRKYSGHSLTSGADVPSNSISIGLLRSQFSHEKSRDGRKVRWGCKLILIHACIIARNGSSTWTQGTIPGNPCSIPLIGCCCPLRLQPRPLYQRGTAEPAPSLKLMTEPSIAVGLTPCFYHPSFRSTVVPMPQNAGTGLHVACAALLLVRYETLPLSQHQQTSQGKVGFALLAPKSRAILSSYSFHIPLSHILSVLRALDSSTWNSAWGELCIDLS